MLLKKSQTPQTTDVNKSRAQGYSLERLIVPLLAFVLAFAVSVALVVWAQARIARMERRLESLTQQLDDVSAKALAAASAHAASRPATGAPPSGTPDAPAVAQKPEKPSLSEQQVGKIVAFVPKQNVMTICVDSGQLIEGSDVMQVAASFGDVPRNGVYIYDRGSIKFNFRVAAHAPLVIEGSLDSSVTPPSDALELAQAFRRKEKWTRDSYFALEVVGGYVLSITRIDY